MTTTFQSVARGDAYTLSITLSNGNRVDMDMMPYLNRAELSALKDAGVWKSLRVTDGNMCWDGAVQFSVQALLSLLREEDGGCAIANASTGDDWRLHLQFKNGASLSMDMEPLLEYSVFAPLVHKELWRTLRAKEQSLVWEDESLLLELPMGTILRYFA